MHVYYCYHNKHCKVMYRFLLSFPTPLIGIYAGAVLGVLVIFIVIIIVVLVSSAV